MNHFHRALAAALFALTLHALGETLLVTPKPGSIHVRKLLLIGLGDLQGFTPAREHLVGTVVFQEAAQLGIANPYFAPTVLDGGKAGIDTGDTAEQFLYGFLRARATELALHAAGMASGDGPAKLTFLAGAAHAESTRAGVAKALESEEGLASIPGLSGVKMKQGRYVNQRAQEKGTQMCPFFRIAGRSSRSVGIC